MLQTQPIGQPKVDGWGFLGGYERARFSTFCSPEPLSLLSLSRPGPEISCCCPFGLGWTKRWARGSVETDTMKYSCLSLPEMDS